MEASCWDQAHQNQEPLWALFLDFSKSYDTLNYHFLKAAMLHFGVDPTLTETSFRWQISNTRKIACQRLSSQHKAPLMSVL